MNRRQGAAISPTAFSMNTAGDIITFPMKEQQEKLNAYASMSTKNIQKKANISSNVDNSEVSADSYSEVKEAKPGSMMAKANMVRDYNEKNSRK